MGGVMGVGTDEGHAQADLVAVEWRDRANELRPPHVQVQIGPVGAGLMAIAPGQTGGERAKQRGYVRGVSIQPGQRARQVTDQRMRGGRIRRLLYRRPVDQGFYARRFLARSALGPVQPSAQALQNFGEVAAHLFSSDSSAATVWPMRRPSPCRRQAASASS